MAQKQEGQGFVSQLQAAIEAKSSPRPASVLVKNIEVAAAISKLVLPREQSPFKATDPTTDAMLTNVGIEQISKTIMTRVEDNENIFHLFPDIELAVQIIVSSILSPKDMVKSELIYRCENQQLPPEMVAKLLDIVKEELEVTYKFKSELPDILRDALFLKGSHVKAVLPESAVDELINRRTGVATESLYSPDLFTEDHSLRSVGWLGNSSPIPTRKGWKVSLESAATEVYDPTIALPKLDSEEHAIFSLKGVYNLIKETVQVVDNAQALKLPKLIARASEIRLSKLRASPLEQAANAFAMEAFDARVDTTERPTPRELSGMIYKSAQSDYRPYTRLSAPDNLFRRSVGRPLVINLPSEAAIPVYVPGDPRDHIGYFVPIDTDGNPITIDSSSYDSGQGLGSMLQADKSNTSMSSLLTEKARRNLGNSTIVPTIEHLSDLYADIIENDLVERLSRGAYGRKLQVSRNNEIYRIMLSRTLKSQFTRLIYIPADYVTYFAFNHHRNGVGKSYLDEISNISSLRAMVLFSKVMAKVKSSITTTHVDVELDPRDPDPMRTIELSKHLVAKTRQQYFPHGLNRVVDLTDWMHRAGLQLTFKGHPKIPNTAFTFESKSVDHTMPNDDLDEMFRHQTYMHFGLSPETVDSAVRADFATTIEKSSLLFARRIMILSDKTSECATDYLRKLLKNDETAQARLAEAMLGFKGVIEKNLSDEEKVLYGKNPHGLMSLLIQEFIDTVVVDLPKPDSTKNENLKAEIQSYEEIVDKGLQFIFSQEVLPAELGGEASQYADALKATWKATLMRRWMSQNNFAPELFEITDVSDDNQPMANLLEMTQSYSKTVMLNIASFLNNMKAAKEAIKEDLAQINPGESSGGESGGDDYASGFGEEGGEDTAENNPFDAAVDADEGGTDDQTAENGAPTPDASEKSPFDAALKDNASGDAAP